MSLREAAREGAFDGRLEFEPGSSGEAQELFENLCAALISRDQIDLGETPGDPPGSGTFLVIGLSWEGYVAVFRTRSTRWV